MGKHSKDGAPSTGNGRTSNPKNKPSKTQVTVRKDSGSVVWWQTVSLFKRKQK